MMAEEVLSERVGLFQKNLALTRRTSPWPSQTSPNPLLLGEGLQDFQSLEEEIYLLLIGGGGHRPVEVLGEDLGEKS